ncbi:hypothetical protein G6F43_011955 [Rhizopus delemar]|nr:hypothetical protein G6F43_011955 [Rhizopus delemar]
MADLQHLVPKNDPIRQLREAMDVGNVETMLNYEPTKGEDALGDLHNIPPPMFSARMTVTDYGYRQNLPVLRVKVKQPDGSYKIGLINRDRRAALELTQVKFDVENIPTQSWQLIKKAVDPVINKAIELVGELFEQRPIWTRYAIRCVLEPKYSKHLIKALANHAYTFTNGPWRDTWVKYGVDPRKNVEYHKYQILDARRFHDSESKTNKYTGIKSVMMYKRRDASNESVNLTNKHIFDGHSTPGPSSMYQLCDITDPEITPLLYNKNYLQEEANVHSGYYYQCVFDRIRRYTREKQVHLVKEKKPLHIPNAEKGLMNEVEQEKQKKEYEKINQTTAEKAVAEAQAEMAKPGSSQRLKEVVDEYIEGLEESKSGDKPEYLVGDDDGDDDSDLDLIDTLEEYDEDFDVFNEDDENEMIEDEENQGENMNIDE